MSEKLWAGRFSETTNRGVEAFTSSIDIDKRLYSHDIEGSIAHCKMLAKQQIITEEEASALIRGLNNIKSDIKRGRFEFDNALEDIHMHIESQLAKDLGKVAQKLHTARSRNDQVALDVRMYLREKSLGLINILLQFRKVILNSAQKHIKVIMPGYTHLQRAQPILFSHHLMAYYEMFKRDTERFKDCMKRINVMPLGSAALAGTTFPIDRDYTAKLLNFADVSANSIDSVADRDFIMEFLSAASICMVHLSRMSEELILWSSSEFDFIELSDAFTTGSSIMPQKKNPDVAELVRGKTGRVFGSLINILTLMKSLPMAYNRDMQEDKECLFDAADTLRACLHIYSDMLPNMNIKEKNMLKATSTGFLNATDMADYLATKGMPFRQAHHCVGRIVQYAIENEKEIHDLTLDELNSFSKFISQDIFHALSTEQVVNRRTSAGGTASQNVESAISLAQEEIAVQMKGIK
ncbi:Argininosuccinate lyase [Candidatus Magnetomoraceae bacterium gMMP-15]